MLASHLDPRKYDRAVRLLALGAGYDPCDFVLSLDDEPPPETDPMRMDIPPLDGDALYQPETPVDALAEARAFDGPTGPCGTCGLPHPCCGLTFDGLPAGDSLAVQAADELARGRKEEYLS